LTDRQLAVLRLVAQGLSNKEIAQSLELAPETVKTHLARVQSILGAKNRTDAVTRGRDLL
jgi:LuxR family maltose regulon positive regulatory protein